jgi:hypothetical protein
MKAFSCYLSFIQYKGTSFSFFLFHESFFLLI